MKNWWWRNKPSLLGPMVYALVRLIGFTLRIKTLGYENVRSLPTGKIYAGWHGRTFVAAIFFRNQDIWTIISNSRDGEIQNRIFTRLGFHSIRGSSGSAKSGTRAAIESIRVLRQGHTMAFTPDGPRGPSGIVQNGIMLMAQKSGAALIPVGVSANRRWLARSWDRYMVPKPFARCIMIYGNPIYVPAKALPEELETIRQRLESEMHRLEKEAETWAGH